MCEFSTLRPWCTESAQLQYLIKRDISSSATESLPVHQCLLVCACVTWCFVLLRLHQHTTVYGKEETWERCWEMFSSSFKKHVCAINTHVWVLSNPVLIGVMVGWPRQCTRHRYWPPLFSLGLLSDVFKFGSFSYFIPMVSFHWTTGESIKLKRMTDSFGSLLLSILSMHEFEPVTVSGLWASILSLAQCGHSARREAGRVGEHLHICWCFFPFPDNMWAAKVGAGTPPELHHLGLLFGDARVHVVHSERARCWSPSTLWQGIKYVKSFGPTSLWGANGGAGIKEGRNKSFCDPVKQLLHQMQRN